MRLLDLFAGIGGFSYAGHQLGWSTVAFVEREGFCQRVLVKNFGAVLAEEDDLPQRRKDAEESTWAGSPRSGRPVIYGDIFEFDGKPFRGRVDVVTGGFPCQPFSAAGKRRGRSDERHLFPEMLRVIREVEPRWVVAENVRGLLSIESGAVFAEVVTSLEGEGYEVITFCIPASAVGAPHRRDRLWIVARRVDTDSIG
ncbi:MAG: DNA (cytosine-5-)-methyltransferase, partial [Acidobacteria bacterium]|nr:DNA (cytosine-5-)-methyltransferase [Acidobacteriota bacterium]